MALAVGGGSNRRRAGVAASGSGESIARFWCARLPRRGRGCAQALWRPLSGALGRPEWLSSSGGGRRRADRAGGQLRQPCAIHLASWRSDGCSFHRPAPFSHPNLALVLGDARVPGYRGGLGRRRAGRRLGTGWVFVRRDPESNPDAHPVSRTNGCPKALAGTRRRRLAAAEFLRAKLESTLRALAQERRTPWN